MLEEQYTDIQVVVLDSLCATLMQAVYVLEIFRMRDAGYSLEHSVEIIKMLTKTAGILFPVGNLDYLQKGGPIGETIGVHAGPHSIGYGVIRRSDRLSQ